MMLAATPKAGRPKGLRVAVCSCGWRVASMGKSATCGECGKRITFPKRRRRKPKAKS